MRTFDCVIQVSGEPVQGEIKAQTILQAAEIFCEQRLGIDLTGSARSEGSVIRKGRHFTCFSYNVPGHNGNRLYVYDEVNPVRIGP